MRPFPVLMALGLSLAFGSAAVAQTADPAAPAPAAPDPSSPDPVVRGAYIFAAGGCAA